MEHFFKVLHRGENPGLISPYHCILLGSRQTGYRLG